MIQFLSDLPLFVQVAAGILLSGMVIIAVYVVGKIVLAAVDHVDRYFYRKKRLSH